MAASFTVFTTRAFDRSAKRLNKKNLDVPGMLDALLPVLETDPLNISRRHNIKKLVGVEEGDGQWRIRSGVYRLRYDVHSNRVILHSISHRKEAY